MGTELTLSVAMIEVLIVILVATYVWSRDRSRRERAYRVLKMLLGRRRSNVPDRDPGPSDD